MAQAEEVMGRVAGTQRMDDLARENAFTGSGSVTYNQFTTNIGNMIADERSKDELARDLQRRMVKMGLVKAGAAA
jgi:hypothetical protein